MTLLPLELTHQVTAPDGASYRWAPNAMPGDRLSSFSFRTKVGEGFSDASGSLARRIDRDYRDLQLANDVVSYGADGSIAYEGRIAAMPRDLSNTHSIGVTLAGHMAHAKDRRFSEIYVDRDQSGWGPMSRGRRAALLLSNVTPFDPEQATDLTGAQAGITTAITDAWASPYTPVSEAWYDAGPEVMIGRVVYSWQRESTTINTSDTSWQWFVGIATNDNTTGTPSANLRAAGPSTGQTFTPPTPRRFAWIQLYYSATPAGASGARFAVDFYKLAVYGTHGLPTYTGEPGEPPGVYASDVLRDIVKRWCPNLNADGVLASNYVIQHLAFKDRTYPYDAFLELNKYHLWHLGVWENKTLTFRPYDFTDYDWEVRTDDPGTTFSPQGPSTDDLFNGVVVTYTDLLTGVKNVLTPDAYPDLQDTSPTNPWNQQGINHWFEDAELSTPTLQAQALQIGRAKLADANRPKAPGTIAVTGYIRDRQGNKQPGWKVRAGQMVSVTNFPNDRPRLITETDWDDDSKKLTITVDSPSPLLDAYLDRVGTALTAKGIES